MPRSGRRVEEPNLVPIVLSLAFIYLVVTGGLTDLNGTLTNIGQWISDLISPPLNPPHYDCSICGASFTTPDALATHIASAHPNPTYTCPICNLAFESAEALATHIQNAHKVEPLEAIWTSRGVQGFEGGTLTIDDDGFGEVSTVSGTATVVTTPVYKGTYAVKLQATERAQIGRWGGYSGAADSIRTQTDAYYGWALYIGPGFTVSSWSQIAQLLPISGYGRFVALELAGTTNPHLRLTTNYPSDISGNYYELWNDPFAAPQGSWFTVIIHLVTKDKASGGLIECWINKTPYTIPGAGVKVATFPANLKSMVSYPGPAMAANIYQPANGPNNWIVVDEMICSSNLQSVINFLHP